MPSHSAAPAAGTRTEAGGGTGSGDTEEDTGLVGKMKNLFRRSSTSQGIPTKSSIDGSTELNDRAETGHTLNSEQVLDQTAQGEMLPSAKGNASGATNLNANAEMGWPGVVQGHKLGAVVISLGGIDKNKVSLGGGKKGEGSWVMVPITSHFSHFVHPMIDTVGSNKHEGFPKSGTIKFEFDKDWIGAKGEAEVLHHSISNAVAKAVSSPTSGSERTFPEAANFKLGGRNRSHVPEEAVDEADEFDEGPGGPLDSGNAAAQGRGQGLGYRLGQGQTHGHNTAVLAPEVGQGESVASSRSGKVGGD